MFFRNVDRLQYSNYRILWRMKNVVQIVDDIVYTPLRENNSGSAVV